MAFLPDFRLETYFSRWEFTARYNLCASDAETLSLKNLVAMANDDDRDRWDELRLGYIETFGTPALRRAIAGTYDRVAPEEVLAFAGAEEGIYAAMQALLSADDHAIVLTPNYQSAETVPVALCSVTGIPLDPDRDWHLDLDRVRDALRPNTKLISVNFPHNPTGRVIPRFDFERLIDMARERDIYFFSDEVYRLLERDAGRRLPQAADLYDKALSLNVMSKAYGLPGLRIGWIATRDRQLLSRMERIKHYLSICNSAPSEALAIIALHNREAILARNRELIEANLAELDGFFARHASLFDWRIPDGGCVGFPRYLGDDGVAAFCERAVAEAGVLLLPADVYRSALGNVPGDRFRIGYGRRDMPEALRVLDDHIARSGVSGAKRGVPNP